jgi:hypothetical protein
MRESEVKLLIVKDIRREGGYARRIEDRFSVGAPDLVTIPLNCCVVWLEVKVPTGNILRPSDRQYIELLKLQVPPHSTSFVMGWKNERFYISPPSKGTHLNMCLEKGLTETMSEFIRRATREII